MDCNCFDMEVCDECSGANRIKKLEETIKKVHGVLMHIDYRLDEDLPILKNGIVHLTTKSALKEIEDAR